MDKKITFIFLSSFSSIGGIQTFNNNFLRALDAIGEKHSYKIYALGLNDMNEDIPSYKNINVWCAYGNKILFIVKVLTALYGSKLLIVGHINLSFPLTYLSKFLFPKAKRLLITHGIEAWNITSILKKKAIPFYDLILTVSNFTKEKILQSNEIESDCIKVFPNTVGSDFPFKTNKKPFNLLQKHSLNSGNKILLTVCRIAEKEVEKGYDKVIRVLPEILKEFPEVVYILVGKTESKEKKRIHTLISELELQNNVIITEQISQKELNDYYQLCDLFIMPSKKEGFGIVYLEAILSGRSVVGGKIDGTADALLNGELGILINPDDLEELKLSILNFFYNNISYHLMDKWKLRNRVIEEFGFLKFVERLKLILDS